jgi:hypothetical protein
LTDPLRQLNGPVSGAFNVVGYLSVLAIVMGGGFNCAQFGE